MSLTARSCEIAADMIDAKRFSIDNTSDPETVDAAAFLFDEGVFFLSESGRAEIARLLREKALALKDHSHD